MFAVCARYSTPNTRHIGAHWGRGKIGHLPPPWVKNNMNLKFNKHYLITKTNHLLKCDIKYAYMRIVTLATDLATISHYDVGDKIYAHRKHRSFDPISEKLTRNGRVLW